MVKFSLFSKLVEVISTLPPWKVVGTLYLDSSCVSFKHFAFLSVWDKFELLGHVQVAMKIWVIFSPFFLDSLLVTVSAFIGLFRSACYFNLLCKFRGLPGSTPVSFPVMRRWKCLAMKRLSQPSSTTSGKRAEASNTKSRESLFHFKPEKVNKYKYCDNLWKWNIFHNLVRELKACL